MEKSEHPLPLPSLHPPASHSPGVHSLHMHWLSGTTNTWAIIEYYYYDSDTMLHTLSSDLWGCIQLNGTDPNYLCPQCQRARCVQCSQCRVWRMNIPHVSRVKLWTGHRVTGHLSINFSCSIHHVTPTHGPAYHLDLPVTSQTRHLIPEPWPGPHC